MMKRKIALLMACVLLIGTSFSTYATEPDTAGQTVEEGGEQPGQTTSVPETGIVPGTGDVPETGAVPGTGDVPEETIAPVATGQPDDAALPEDTQPGGTAVPEETAVPEGAGQPGADTSRSQTMAGNIGQVDVSIGAVLILGAPVDFAVTLTDARGGVQESFMTLGEDNGSGQEKRCSFTGLAAGDYTLVVTGEGFATYTQKVTVRGRESVKLMTGFLKGKGVEYVEGKPHRASY